MKLETPEALEQELARDPVQRYRAERAKFLAKHNTAHDALMNTAKAAWNEEQNRGNPHRRHQP